MASSSVYVLSRGAACLSCRRKKQRCDGGKPACGPCLKSGKECMYRDLRYSRPPLLIDEVRRLEEKIERFQTKSSPSESPSPTSSDAGSPGRTPSPPRTTWFEGRFFSGTPSFQNRVPGINMGWYYDPTAIANLQIQPSDLPQRLREDLIGIFMQNREMCFLYIHVGHFTASLSLPPTDPQAPHPALIDSILLVGCYFSRTSSLADYEAGLLAAANNNLLTSFRRRDRLHDFIRASNLVAFYYFCKGLYREAYKQIVMSCHMVMICGLHQIPSSARTYMGTNGDESKFLPDPVDATEQGDRIHTFWQTFCLDKMISMVVNEPAKLLNGLNADPLLQISTQWPRLFSDNEAGTVSELCEKSVTNLHMNQMSTMHVSLETLANLRSQGYALLYKAFHLLSDSPMPQEILATDSAIQTFTSRLPHLMSSEDYEIPTIHDLSQIGHRIATIHTLAQVASLVLHQHGVDALARRRCLNAAQGVTDVISQLEDADYSELFIGLGHLWYMAGRILLMISAKENVPVAEQTKGWALVIISALKRISMVYVPLNLKLLQLQEFCR